MPIKVTCSSCSGVLHAPDDAAGKRGRCPTCGMILTIPADAPRVAAEPPPAFGIPPSAESLAFPRPPAFGDSAKSSYSIGSASVTAAPAQSRLPPDPRRFADPFAKPGRAPQAVQTDALAHRWNRVDGGLGLIRTAAVLITLGVLIPSGLVIAEQNGVTLPVKNPGLLGVAGVSMAGELKAGSAILLFTLGGLFFILGRARVAAVPAETGARTLTTASTLFTVISFLAFVITVGIGMKATFDGSPPQFVPQPDLLSPTLKLQDQFEGYGRQIFMDSATMLGKVQRLAAVTFLAAAVISDLWLLGALSRLAGYLRNRRALGRVNRFAVIAGLLIFLAPVMTVAYDLFGRDTVDANWNAMAASLQETVRTGTAAGLFTIMAFLYTRSLRGLRTAIREITPP